MDSLEPLSEPANGSRLSSPAHRSPASGCITHFARGRCSLQMPHSPARSRLSASLALSRIALISRQTTHLHSQEGGQRTAPCARGESTQVSGCFCLPSINYRLVNQLYSLIASLSSLFCVAFSSHRIIFIEAEGVASFCWSSSNVCFPCSEIFYAA